MYDLEMSEEEYEWVGKQCSDSSHCCDEKMVLNDSDIQESTSKSKGVGMGKMVCPFVQIFEIECM